VSEWKPYWDPPNGPWAQFRSWHKQSSLYREIYARTVATLLAAFVIVVVGGLVGAVDGRPVIVLMTIVAGMTVVLAIAGLVWLWSSEPFLLGLGEDALSILPPEMVEKVRKDPEAHHRAFQRKETRFILVTSFAVLVVCAGVILAIR
jgi:hypothetical protein